MRGLPGGLGVGRNAYDADRRAGRRVACPVLFLRAARDDMEDLYGDPLEVSRDRADDLRGGSVDSGHHIAEEAPDELAAELRRFPGEVRQEIPPAPSHPLV